MELPCIVELRFRFVFVDLHVVFYKRTYGCANIIGKAFSWILDGLLKPILYTPFSNSGFLLKRQKKVIL